MKIKDVMVEHELISDRYQVRGFADLVIIGEDDRVYIYDIKSMNAWSYRMRFGRKKSSNPSIHQELQVATYGLMLEESLGRIDGMHVIFYNKDNSTIKILDLGREMLLSAQSYWEGIKDLHRNGLPSKEEGVSPVMDWECNYCNFKTQCDADHMKGE